MTRDDRRFFSFFFGETTALPWPAIALAAAFVAIACLVAASGGVADAKQLLARARTTAGGDRGVRYALLNSAAARHYVVPPVVRAQMIENWVRMFCAEHVDAARRRVDRASARMSELREARCRAEFAARFELAALARAKWHLHSRGVGTTSVATQTPPRASAAGGKRPRHVRWVRGAWGGDPTRWVVGR